MFFINYSEVEKQIFNGVKKYFEALPPLSSDDYENGFYDIVAQFEGGGQSYIGIGEEYERLTESQVLTGIEDLSIADKIDLQEFYELNFLENYYDDDTNKYFYSDDDLAVQVTGRFKTWIDDNFNLDEMLNEDEDEENDEEDEEDIDL